jgi:hypothetical protein
MNDPQKNIKFSQHLINQLNHEANKNPIKTLLQEKPLPNLNHSADVVSGITVIIAFLGVAAGLFSLYYVYSQIPKISSNESTGIDIIKNNLSITKLNTHYVCVPGNTSISLSLLDPNLCQLNDYVSVSLPIAISDSSDSRSVTVSWTNDDASRSYGILPNSGALFMIANELQKYRWKLVREWS